MNKPFWANLWRILYMGTNDQIMQGWKLMVKRSQRSSQVSFLLIDSDLGYWYIIWKVSTTNRGLNLKNTFCTLCLWDRGWPFLWCLEALLDLHIYGLDSWRSQLRRCSQNRKGLGSNPGSRWPWGQMRLTSGKRRCPSIVVQN